MMSSGQTLMGFMSLNTKDALQASQSHAHHTNQTLPTKCQRNALPSQGFKETIIFYTFLRATLLSKMDFVANVHKTYSSLFQLKGVVCMPIFSEHKRGLFSKLMAADHAEWLQFTSQSCVPAFRWTVTCHESCALHRKQSWAQTESTVLLLHCCHNPTHAEQTQRLASDGEVWWLIPDAGVLKPIKPLGLTWVNGCTPHFLTNAGFEQRNVKNLEQTSSVMLCMRQQQHNHVTTALTWWAVRFGEYQQKVMQLQTLSLQCSMQLSPKFEDTCTPHVWRWSPN